MKKIFLVSCFTMLFLTLITQGGEAMELKLNSSAFDNGEFIPAKYTCKGIDVSPQLSWDGVPEATKSLAVICDDPDAPMGTWVHWVIYDIPADKNQLQEGVEARKTLDDGSKQGVNDFGKIGYGGPCPPPGSAHRYFFKLYALDVKLDARAGLTKSALLKAMEGHIIGKAELMGKFKR